MAIKELAPKILEILSSPILLIDRNYVVVDVNNAARAYFGELLSEIQGNHCFHVTHGFDRPCWQVEEEITCPLKQALETGKQSRCIHKHLIGDRLTIEEVVATPVPEDTSETNFVIEEFRDITELLELQETILIACSSCNKIRDKQGNWHKLSVYIRKHTGAEVSHSFCPDCFARLYPEHAHSQKKRTE